MFLQRGKERKRGFLFTENIENTENNSFSPCSNYLFFSLSLYLFVNIIFFPLYLFISLFKLSFFPLYLFISFSLCSIYFFALAIIGLVRIKFSISCRIICCWLLNLAICVSFSFSVPTIFRFVGLIYFLPLIKPKCR